MFVVIFRAKTATLDDDYFQAAEELRKLAIEQFGCIEFVSFAEGDQEVALSYWQDEEAIKRWKVCSDHVVAQVSGRSQWYKSYTVEVGEIKRAYTSDLN